MVIRPLSPLNGRRAVSRIYERSWKFAYRHIIPQSYLDSISPEGWISFLPEFMGRGYGQPLLDAAAHALARMNYAEIFLWVLAENRMARRFYEKAGFSPSGYGRWEDFGGKQLLELPDLCPAAKLLYKVVLHLFGNLRNASWREDNAARRRQIFAGIRDVFQDNLAKGWRHQTRPDGVWKGFEQVSNLTKGNAMRKRAFTFLLPLFLLIAGYPAAAALTGFESSPEHRLETAEPSETAEIPPEHCIHSAYLSGSDEPLPAFFPNQPLSREQAAQMIDSLRSELPELPLSFIGLPENQWFDAGTDFSEAASENPPVSQPDKPVTRAEFTRFLAAFFEPREDAALFPDVPETHTAASAIRTARALGWVQGSESGLFRPDEAITRVEAAVMLNRALGRTPDREYIGRTRPAFFRDVSPANWYYYEIMEAAVPHEADLVHELEAWTAHTPPSEAPFEGFYSIENQLYYYDSEKQDILRNEAREHLQFSASGQCAADRPRLDEKMRAAVSERADARIILAEMEQILADEAAAMDAEPEWNLILINGDNPLPEGFAVPELAALDNGYRIDSRVYPALQSMLEDARSAGYRPLVCSAYRTWEKQTSLHQQKIHYYRQRGYSWEKAADAAAFWVARPGTSEHQAGLAVDIVDSAYPVLNQSQENRPVQKWLMEHCAEYGFILRYPTDKSALTGVGYEPWHYRYVGLEAAADIMSRGICLEEYLAGPAESAGTGSGT